MALENPDEKNPSTPQADQNTKDDNARIDGAIPTVIGPQVEPPPAHPYYKISCEKKRDGWDYAKMITEFIGIGFLIVYTIYTVGIYCANRKAAQAAQDTLHQIQQQTTLMRQEMVGTYAAIIPQQSPWPRAIPDDLELLKYTGIGITFQNVGRVKAKQFTADITMTRESIPAYRTIGHPQRKQVTQAEMRPRDQNGPQGYADAANIKFNTSMITSHDIDLLHHLGETIEISGSFRYDNGFDETIQRKFCLIYINIPQHSFAGGTVGGGGNEDWVPCEEGKFAIKQALSWKQEP